jgi:hypothetical protein
MKAANSICRRCHRLRPTDGARYCTACSDELRAMERRRPVVDASEDAALAPAEANATVPPPPLAAAAPPMPPADPPPAAVQLSPDVVPLFVLPMGFAQ